METPVTGWVSILNKDTKKASFQSPVDSVQEDELSGFSTPLVSLKFMTNTFFPFLSLSLKPLAQSPLLVKICDN